jgi:hypothetical protein
LEPSLVDLYDQEGDETMRVLRGGLVAGSWRYFVISAALALAAALSVVPAQAAAAASSSVSIVLPASGATLSGSQWFDAVPNGSGDTGVEFVLSSTASTGPCSLATGPCTVGNATLTWIGWVVNWNTDNVPNGSYNLVATVQPGLATTSIPVTVSNSPPTVVYPANNSIVSGSQWFDCVPPPDVTQVVFLFRGPGGISVGWSGNLTWVGWINYLGNFKSGTWSVSCSGTYPEGGIGVGPPISFTA